MTVSLADCLSRAAEYRFRHLLLRPPAPGRRKELRALAAEMDWEGKPDPAPLLAPSDDAAIEEVFRLIGQAGTVSACASDYVGAGYADKGPILADVAGFYRAFGFEPSLPENPDHFACLFEFLSFLALKQAWAREAKEGDQEELARDAERKLLADHVTPYLGRFAEKLAASAFPGGVFEPVAAYLKREEVRT